MSKTRWWRTPAVAFLLAAGGCVSPPLIQVETVIHGDGSCDRTIWQRYRTSNSSNQKHYLIQPPGGWQIGSRLSHHDYGGYVPIGFFQMWNRESNISRYPTTEDGGAEHTDLLHGLQWPRPNRVLIPEIIAVHLESEPSSMGANWNGRTTKAFGPESRGSSMMAGDSVHRPAPQRPSEFFSGAHGYDQGK